LHIDATPPLAVSRIKQRGIAGIFRSDFFQDNLRRCIREAASGRKRDPPMPSSSNSSSGSTTTSTQLNYGVFYTGGPTFNASTGVFVKS
jgi:hypothetical protein